MASAHAPPHSTTVSVTSRECELQRMRFPSSVELRASRVQDAGRLELWPPTLSPLGRPLRCFPASIDADHQFADVQPVPSNHDTTLTAPDAQAFPLLPLPALGES